MANPEEIKEILEEEVPFQEIESILHSKLCRSDHERKIIGNILDYDEKILTDGGKRIRVALPYLIAKGLDIDYQDHEIIEALIPLEIYHGASLIMDDVIDEDKTRRGIETPHHKFKAYGYSEKQAESVAILDAAEIQSIALTTSHEMSFLSNRQKIEITNIVKKSVSDVSRGQIIDVSAENSLHEDFEESLGYCGKSLDYEDLYIDLIESKAVSLFEAGVKVIEVIADENLDHLSKYMNNLGKAYQIRDDILDITGGRGRIELEDNLDSNKIGKDRYSDLMEGSMTLPIFYGLEMTAEKQIESLNGTPYNISPTETLEGNIESKRKLLETILEKDNPEKFELHSAAKLIEECGAIQKAQGKAESYAEKAVTHSEKSDLEREYRSYLESLAYYATTRSN